MKYIFAFVLKVVVFLLVVALVVWAWVVWNTIVVIWDFNLKNTLNLRKVFVVTKNKSDEMIADIIKEPFPYLVGTSVIILVCMIIKISLIY